MKKILLAFSFLLCTISFSKAQSIVIPDSIFRNYLLNNTAINTNGDTSITVAEAAAFNDTLALWHYHVNTLTGLQYFINITGLDCEGECCGILGLLRDLDVSHCTKLKWLNCYNNQLHDLDLSHNPDLLVLDCESNPLGSLDLTNNSLLKELYCSSDSLSAINVSGASQLEQFYCMNNQLTNLDVTNNSALKALYCSNNNFPTVNVSHNAALEELLCVADHLTSLDVSNNLLLSYFYSNTNPDLSTICVNSVSYANAQETVMGYIKDSTAAWSETCTTGIPDVHLNSLSISPNPSRGQFNFSGLEGENTIEIYDLTGRLISKVLSTESSYNLDLSAKEKGVYFYKVIDAKQNMRSGKIILQ